MTGSGDRQTTLAREIELAGVGLHTGAPIRLRLRPATAGEGIVFARTDLPGAPRVEARPEAIDRAALQRRTRLVNAEGVAVETIEHLLAACLGMGLDNARAELDGPEAPILDGSAEPFATAIAEAGLTELEAPRRRWRLRRPVVLSTGEAELCALPAERMSVTFFAELRHAGISSQALSIELTPERFRREVAPARTFVFFEDVARLYAAGLIRGASLDCAIVVRNGTPHQGNGSLAAETLNGEAIEEELKRLLRPCAYRLENELAAHKLLDLIGDLAILGNPVNAFMTARGSGHALHHRFIDLLRKELVE